MKKLFSILCMIMMISCSNPKNNVILTDQANNSCISEDYVGNGIVTSVELGFHDRWQIFVVSMRDINTKNIVKFKAKKLIYNIDDTIHVNVIENRINRLGDTTKTIISGAYVENSQGDPSLGKYK